MLRKINKLFKYYHLTNTSNKLLRCTSTAATIRERIIPDDKLTLKDFLIVGKNLPKENQQIEEDLIPPYLKNIELNGDNRKVYFDVYGCQMNVNDIEIVWSILKSKNYQKTQNINEADIILIMTCSIRDSAEEKIWNRLKHLKAIKKKRSKMLTPLQIGILGCMAERLKVDMVEKEKSIDVICGPDAYKGR